MRMVASGNNQKCDVIVQGLGKSQVIVEFDDKNHKVINIMFEGPRPEIQNSIKKSLNQFKKSDEEIRHIRSHEWIKENIKRQYVDKTVQSQMRKNNLLSAMLVSKTLNHPKTVSKPDYKGLTLKIANEYLEKTAQTASNLFKGDKYHNNCSGKLCAILKPYITQGKEAFEKKLPRVIEIPVNTNFGKDNDFFKIVREELDIDKIQIESWDMLLELYFAVNYDEADKQVTYKKTEEKNCQARQDFLNTFEYYGKYTWQPTLFPNEKINKSTAAPKHILKENFSDEETKRELSKNNKKPRIEIEIFTEAGKEHVIPDGKEKLTKIGKKEMSDNEKENNSVSDNSFSFS